jgi:hypothetical protein
LNSMFMRAVDLAFLLWRPTSLSSGKNTFQGAPFPTPLTRPRCSTPPRAFPRGSSHLSQSTESWDAWVWVCFCIKFDLS